MVRRQEEGLTEEEFSVIIVMRMDTSHDSVQREDEEIRKKQEATRRPPARNQSHVSTLVPEMQEE